MYIIKTTHDKITNRLLKQKKNYRFTNNKFRNKQIHKEIKLTVVVPKKIIIVDDQSSVILVASGLKKNHNNNNNNLSLQH